VKLRVCRSSPVSVVTAPQALIAPVPVAQVGAAASPAQAAAVPAAAAAEPAEPALAGTVVKSPIVGTFYRSPDPNSAPFVSVGDRIKVGQVLCIIEAMKLMNEIEAELAGEVLKIHVENGQPVQYGDPLFTVKPA
jgi:acetyl-CoA carboxylase biotin carboxyl carrier protein